MTHYASDATPTNQTDSALDDPITESRPHRLLVALAAGAGVCAIAGAAFATVGLGRSNQTQVQSVAPSDPAASPRTGVAVPDKSQIEITPSVTARATASTITGMRWDASDDNAAHLATRLAVLVPAGWTLDQVRSVTGSGISDVTYRAKDGALLEVSRQTLPIGIPMPSVPGGTTSLATTTSGMTVQLTIRPTADGLVLSAMRSDGVLTQVTLADNSVAANQSRSLLTTDSLRALALAAEG